MQPDRASLVTFALASGMLLPLQALINGRLAGHLQSPFLASAAQNLVGACAALLVAVIFWPPRVGLAQFAQAPVWAWVGGVLGMVYVLGGVIVAPRVGVTTMMTCVIFGQLVASLLLDQFGVLHARRPIDGTAIMGVALLLAGSILILRRA